ncbi:50S ribosomal protein L4, putative [Eimeria praecox]|uniref:50S ribosomal protein L4, putative n=1 Tax=Eimeria praecox TaxID=51316 RepID=U6H523_9EIME|nr:50S ribosomal protein L4, putative [Eimeria praecox]
MAVITLKALQQLLYLLQQQQQQRGPRYSTPDSLPAPPPSAVPGWADEWLLIKKREREAKFDRKRIRELAAKWVWSSEPKGLLDEEPLEEDTEDTEQLAAALEARDREEEWLMSDASKL